MQTEAYKYYRTLAVQVKDNFKPQQALEGLKRIEDRATQDTSLDLEEKVEFLKLLDFHRKTIQKGLEL
jgi:hypothetical protein